MSKIIIYHGSKNVIKKPVYGEGNIYNDYGRAFYCTRNIELAKEWAVYENEDGFANCYELNMTGLKELNLGDGNYSILNWLAILLENRTFRINSDIGKLVNEYITTEFNVDYKSYDVIRGYRADDSYFSFANAFVNNGLSLDKLYKVMRLGDLGEQIAIKSKKAFSHLEYVGVEPADCNVYFKKKSFRDRTARLEYVNEKDNLTNGIYALDIVRGKWKNADERLQRVIY